MKNINLDKCRFIAALLVVAIHTSPLLNINVSLDSYLVRVVARLALPLFMMISSYYILDKALINKNILVKYTKKISKIYLFCIILYLPLNLYAGYFTDFNFIEFLKDIFITGTTYHLWYFPALVTALWFVYFLIKYLKPSICLILVISLYIIGLFGDNYYGLISNVNIIKIFYEYVFMMFDYSRNALFYMPIFIYMAYLIKINKLKSSKYDLLYVAFSFIMMSIEFIFVYYFDLDQHNTMYFFLVPLMYYLFKYLINNNHNQNKEIRNISTIIYIIHPMLIVVVRFLANLVDLKELVVNNNFLMYILVVFSSYICGHFIQKYNYKEQ